MPTLNTTKALHRDGAGATLVHYQPARPLPSGSLESSAEGLDFRYWLRDLVLAGNQSRVYQAHDLILNRPCAVKRMDSSGNDVGIVQQRFLHEAEVLSRLSHPNIVEVYECTRDEQGELFSVMEPLAGRGLGSLLAEENVVPLERTLEILRAVGAALQHAHDHGIVHQDISPNSIFLNKESSRTTCAVEVVKVMNFEVAKQLDADGCGPERSLRLGLVFDTPTYLAPEALELSSEGVDGRADQWSLAVLAYRMLSGQLPFWADDPWCLRALIRGAGAPVPLAQLRPELPAYVHCAIHKALSKNKAQRYGSIADFIRALHGRPILGTLSELQTAVTEQRRSVSSLLAAAHTSLAIELPTTEYPALSFPRELLSSADEETKLDPEPEQEPARLPRLPAPRLTPPWTAGHVAPQPRRVNRRFWLVCCLVMAVAPAPVVAALHYLHAGPPVETLADKSPVATPQPQLVAAPSADDTNRERPTTAAKTQAAPSHQARARTSVGATSHHNTAGYRNKISRQRTQAILVAGLGL